MGWFSHARGTGMSLAYLGPVAVLVEIVRMRDCTDGFWMSV